MRGRKCLNSAAFLDVNKQRASLKRLKQQVRPQTGRKLQIQRTAAEIRVANFGPAVATEAEVAEVH